MIRSPETGPLAAPARGRGEAVLGLYVHIPFCARRCHFCDFVTGPLRAGRTTAYLRALLREARSERAELSRVAPLDSLFLGGGTPSLVPPRELAGFLRSLRRIFPLAPGAEVSIEVNPEDAEPRRLAAYREAGINRLSLGVQALDAPALGFLNRRHTPAVALRAIAEARRAGFDNLSVDLMFGIPAQTERAYLRGLERVLAEEPAHLSVYALSIEEKSVFGRRARRGELQAAAEEIFERLYYQTVDRAACAGLEQYEISNFARPGRAARHNLFYWRRGDVLGIGVGAVGSCGGERWRNSGSIERYLGHGGTPAREWDERGPNERATEALFLGLRLREGIRPPALRAELGPALWSSIGPVLERLVSAGWLERSRERIRLSRSGLLLSDAVFRELVLLPDERAPGGLAAG